MSVNDRHDPLEEAVERSDHVARGRALGEAGEVADINEHDRDLDLFSFEDPALLEEVVGHLRIDVCAKHLADSFALGEASDHLVESEL